jgi:hypothetical protein
VLAAACRHACLQRVNNAAISISTSACKETWGDAEAAGGALLCNKQTFLFKP